MSLRADRCDSRGLLLLAILTRSEIGKKFLSHECFNKSPLKRILITFSIISARCGQSSEVQDSFLHHPRLNYSPDLGHCRAYRLERFRHLAFGSLRPGFNCFDNHPGLHRHRRRLHLQEVQGGSVAELYSLDSDLSVNLKF